MSVLRTLLHPVLGWPAGSQQRARRNALVASTALAQLRQERHEVEEFLAVHHHRFELRTGSARRASRPAWDVQQDVV
jgi:hypothetical protein